MTPTSDPRDTLPERDIRPVVPLPRARLTGSAIAIGCGLLGFGLFMVLDFNRRAPTAQPTEPVQGSIASPPSLLLPRETSEIAAVPVTANIPAPPAPLPLYQPQPVYPPMMPVYEASPPPPQPSPAAARPAKPSPTSSIDDAVLLMDISPGEARVTNAAAGGTPAAPGEAASAEDTAVRASVIRNRSSLVPQGTLIAAVLETPIHSSRAGLTRAIVSKDIRGFDGTRVLIPRGSRLIGEAAGGAQAGQKRVLVTWTRLIRPDGVAIRIGSPGADQLGGAGLKGSVNNYFLARFGNAVLQSALQIGINRASRNRLDSVFLSIPSQGGGNSVAQVPIFNVPTGPSISIAQGTEISIFVAKDLDFGGTGARQ